MTKPSEPEPVFSLIALACSWAGVSGQTTESILYRLGDWAMTDVFPDDAFLTDATGAATFENESIFRRMLWHQQLSEKISKKEIPGKENAFRSSQTPTCRLLRSRFLDGTSSYRRVAR